jgi:GNAT superfamily N-acetyltransferase
VQHTQKTTISVKDNIVSIYETPICYLPYKQIKSLKNMTLGDKSDMSITLKDERWNPLVQVAIAKSSSGKNLGWACIRPFAKNGRVFIMVYILPECRRQGIGSALVKHFRKRVNFCYRWDELSSKFFDKTGLYNVFDG